MIKVHMTDAVFTDAEEELLILLDRDPTYEEVMDLLNSRYKGREKMDAQDRKAIADKTVDEIFKYLMLMGIVGSVLILAMEFIFLPIITNFIEFICWWSKVTN